MRTWTLLTVLGLFALAAAPANAQTLIEVGPRVGYEIDDLEEVYVGADVRVGLPTLPVKINPVFDYYFSDGASVWQIDVNALYEFGIDNQAFTPYAGAGVALVGVNPDSDFVDSSTEPGFNIVGGAVFGFGQLRPFVNARITLGDFDTTTLGGGVLFTL